MRTWSRAAAGAAVALTLASCSAGSPEPTPSPTPSLNSFESIGAALNCLSLSNSEPETTDIKSNKYCALEQAATPGATVAVYEYADAERRDRSIKAGLVYQQSFLVLSDTWTISGEAAELRRIHERIGQGELRLAETPDAGTGDGVGPGDEEPPLDGYELTDVPFGRSATLGDERVQVGKVFCSDDSDSQSNSCTETSIVDQYGDEVTPPKGHVFYLVAFRWKNVGKAPVDPTDFGNLLTDDDSEYAPDSNLSSSLTSAARGNQDFDVDSEMNPGTTGRILLAYPVPKDARPKKVFWGLEEYSEAPPTFGLAVK